MCLFEMVLHMFLQGIQVLIQDEQFATAAAKPGCVDGIQSKLQTGQCVLEMSLISYGNAVTSKINNTGAPMVTTR